MSHVTLMNESCHQSNRDAWISQVCPSTKTPKKNMQRIKILLFLFSQVHTWPIKMPLFDMRNAGWHANGLIPPFTTMSGKLVMPLAASPALSPLICLQHLRFSLAIPGPRLGLNYPVFVDLQNEIEGQGHASLSGVFSCVLFIPSFLLLTGPRFRHALVSRELVSRHFFCKEATGTPGYPLMIFSYLLGWNFSTFRSCCVNASHGGGSPLVVGNDRCYTCI